MAEEEFSTELGDMAMQLFLGVLFIFMLSKFSHTKGGDIEQFRSTLLEKRDGIVLANIFKRSPGHFRTRLRRQSRMELRSSRSARADVVATEAGIAENEEDRVAGLQRRKRWMKNKCLKHGHTESVAGGAVVNTRTRHFDVANHVQGERFGEGVYSEDESSATSGFVFANSGFLKGQRFCETKHHKTKNPHHETTTSRGSVGIPRAFPDNFVVNMLKK